MRTKLLLTLLSLLLLAGCQSSPRPNQVQRMLAHPQAPLARQYCPAFARDALTIINDLQKENELLKIK